MRRLRRAADLFFVCTALAVTPLLAVTGDAWWIRLLAVLGFAVIHGLVSAAVGAALVQERLRAPDDARQRRIDESHEKFRQSIINLVEAELRRGR